MITVNHTLSNAFVIFKCDIYERQVGQVEVGPQNTQNFPHLNDDVIIFSNEIVHEIWWLKLILVCDSCVRTNCEFVNTLGCICRSSSSGQSSRNYNSFFVSFNKNFLLVIFIIQNTFRTKLLVGVWDANITLSPQNFEWIIETNKK